MPLKLLILSFSLASCTNICCQSQSPVSYQVGDTVPDITFTHMLNYKSGTANLSDFAGKLVILDFWNSWCTACIEAFPKLDSLQYQFKDQIQIILVNAGGEKHDGREKVEKVLADLKKRTGYFPTLPVSILDTILNQSFPHKTVPHEVWISPRGKVIAVTGAGDVTAAHIRSVLSGNDPDMETKNDYGFNSEIPLLTKGNGGNNDRFIYRSIFTGYIAGIGTNQGKRLDNSSQITGCYMTNFPLTNFVHTAYDKLFDSVSQRAVLEVRNPNAFDAKNKAYYYCYDITLPPRSMREFNLRSYLKNDLKRTFNITVSIQKRKIKCLILTAENRQRILSARSRYNEADASLAEENLSKYIHNWPVSEIARYIEAKVGEPVINNTGIETNIDINFPAEFTWSDKQAIYTVLENNGFSIGEEERIMDVAVITDR